MQQGHQPCVKTKKNSKNRPATFTSVFDLYVRLRYVNRLLRAGKSFSNVQVREGLILAIYIWAGFLFSKESFNPLRWLVHGP